MSIRIAVWDDEDTDPHKSKIRQACPDPEMIPFSRKDMERAMSVLIEGITKAPEETRPNPDIAKINHVDVLFIDENLRMLKQARCSTAEDLVPSIRALTDCAAVVVLNRLYFDMDLTMREEGLGDLDVRTEVLDRQWLWADAEIADGFAPWHWPPLVRAREDWDHRLQDIGSNSLGERTIADALLLDPEKVAGDLTATAEEVLIAGAPQGQDPLNMSLQDFFHFGETTVPFKYRGIIAHDPNVVARVCAAELALWVRRYLLAPQNILVDLPHLALRAPWILAGDPNDLASWNACAVREKWPDTAIKRELLEDHVYKGWREWAARPCVYWTSLRADPRFRSARNEFENHCTGEERFWDFVFLEDRSLFAPSEEAFGFKNAHANVWAVRHVSKWVNQADGPGGKYRYGPARRRML